MVLATTHERSNQGIGGVKKIVSSTTSAIEGKENDHPLEREKEGKRQTQRNRQRDRERV